ncbi:MAG: phosphatidate cytidylyltransferase [Prolixibacteraceae bacterium]|nr:phosphatidate cytidylyltransferase [Prolixibacteraceae bacterium]
MRNLLIRTLTGIIYIILIISSTLISKYTFVSLFGIVLTYTLFEFYRLCRKIAYKPHIISGITIALYLFISFFLYDNEIVSETIFWGLIPLSLVIPIIELFHTKKRSVHNIALTFLGIIYIALPFSILNFISTPINDTPTAYMPHVIIILFVILWANDSGAYITGSTLGKHKMFASVSPQKTWEGAIGGLILAVVASIFIFYYFEPIGIFHSVAIAVVTVVTGTLGDLTESMIKRSFKVKDSGKLLPGHGGLLDRFDSMLFAAPAFYLYISIILNS